MSHAVSKHRDEVAFLQALLDDLEKGQPNNDIVQKVRRRIATLDSGLGADEIDAILAASPDSPGTPRGQQPRNPGHWCDVPFHPPHNHGSQPQHFEKHGQPNKEEEMANSVAVLENLAWGRHYGGCYPHRGCVCYFHRSQSELDSINADPGRMRGLYTASLGDYGINLTDVEARKLVQFHIEYIAWHHNAIHSLTFMAQCELFWKTGKHEHPLWMALYLSVLSVSLDRWYICFIHTDLFDLDQTAVWCSQNSNRFQGLLGMRELYLIFRVQLDSHTAPRTTSKPGCRSMGSYDGSISFRKVYRELIKYGPQIALADKIINSTGLIVFSIQAIVISTEVAHNLGKSESNAVLVAAAVRIAQCLGLHKISDAPQPGILTAETWYGRVEREVGKRLWCILRIQDHFAIYFTDSYGKL